MGRTAISRPSSSACRTPGSGAVGVLISLFLLAASLLLGPTPAAYAQVPAEVTLEGPTAAPAVAMPPAALRRILGNLLTWMAGPLVELRAMATTRVNDVETEDCAVAIGRTADGALVTMNVTLGAASESSQLVWHFDNVTITSSSEAYDPSAGPWNFEFRRSAFAEEAEQDRTERAEAEAHREARPNEQDFERLVIAREEGRTDQPGARVAA